MSQQIRVLQCIECNLYQVDIVKKANQWQCKVCRQKQKLLKELFRGSGAECRQKVQELNMKHGQKSQSLDNNKMQKLQKQQHDGHIPSSSKWANYIDELPVHPAPTSHVESKLKLDKANKSDDESYSDADSLPSKRKSNKNTCSKWQEFL
ncbi:uncharacterized protein Dwil_GK24192 [Drosophila willistoni]|uniref:MRN complex-interacting protein N-terminal domain-containing protein n=1 Tax=Drosophila willistoni TaxID=7260 RepID=B4N6W3_DROWI|nr:MRN complex-interacting protein [Drosophila willistoni]EDW80102.1 uncharacterized protein Dwil_GK24192 [Drosophila willistoni]